MSSTTALFTNFIICICCLVFEHYKKSDIRDMALGNDGANTWFRIVALAAIATFLITAIQASMELYQYRTLYDHQGLWCEFDKSGKLYPKKLAKHDMACFKLVHHFFGKTFSLSGVSWSAKSINDNR